MKNKKVIIGIALTILLLTAIGFTYAYFTANVTGNEEAEDVIVEAGTLSLVYEDGQELKLEKAFPGDYIEKVFTVTNTGTLDTEYSINFINLINTITNNELVVSYECTSYKDYIDVDNKGTERGTCLGLTNEPILESELQTTIALSEGIAIPSNITHEYIIRVTFKEMNIVQDYNQGKTFNTKIYINETEENNLLVHKILKDNEVYADNVSSPYVASSTGINFGALSSDRNGKGLYYTGDLTKTQDIDGDGKGEKVYYYRGAVENNYIVFADKCWKIVRTNEDGSIKLRYQGKAINTDGTYTCSTTTTPVTTMAFNTKYDDNAYIGYMYPDVPTTSSMLTMENDTLNKNESEMKVYLDDWYDDNLASYSSNIADTIYCADRTMAEGTKYFALTNTKNPFGKNIVFYGGLGRVTAESTSQTWKPRSDASPQYKCERMEDSFTIDSSIGNGKLDKAIGLLTLDELSYAGALMYNMDESSRNTSFYLYTGYSYWILSPLRADTKNNFIVLMTRLSEVGHIGGSYVNDNTSTSVLPVISLSSKTKISSSGDGTASNPYVVE